MCILNHARAILQPNQNRVDPALLEPLHRVLDRGLEPLGWHFRQCVIGAHLPEYEIGLINEKIALEAFCGGRSEFTRHAAVDHDHVQVLERLLENGLKLGRVGFVGEDAPTPTVEDDPIAMTRIVLSDLSASATCGKGAGVAMS
jgi:hypothetical protein